MLNEKLSIIKQNLLSYKKPLKEMNVNNNDILVFDIEACAIKNHTEMLTYSIAVMNCNEPTDIMYWTNNVSEFMDYLLNLNVKNVKLYAHNCSYDIKPFILDFTSRYNAKQRLPLLVEKDFVNIIDDITLPVKMESKDRAKLDLYEYDLRVKDNIFYSLTIQSDICRITFLDSYKILPMSLKNACQGFLILELSKDGLDYNKERSLEDELTIEEYSYIYDDVYGLKYLIQLCCINGFEANGKHILFTKLTSSGQSLYDYTHTLKEDFENHQNSFEDYSEVYWYLENKLSNNNYYSLDDGKSRDPQKMEDKKAKFIFNGLYPPMNPFNEDWLRLSYYGGLCTPHYENVEKYSKYKNKQGVVLDVNSLYPFCMKTFLLPYGDPIINNKPYLKMTESYKNNYPLYVQEITIYEMDIKPNKMPFIQVKNSPYFSQREILSTNKKDGEYRTIKLRLCNPLLELLFENYNVKAYKLTSHMAFRGSHKLFENYLNFWADVKQNSKGARRVTAKLRQNGLYGKFGMNSNTSILKFENDNGVYKIVNTHEDYISNSIYIPMATFITSYAKKYLVEAVNNNYDRFMYCDTDSLHLFGTLDQVKGLEIDSKKYGAWDNELKFNDFIYISPKRYAEKDIDSGEWIIKCCGLSDDIMKQVSDLTIFTCCDNPKEIKKLISKEEIFTKDNDIYYYYDNKFSKKVKGVFKSKKAKIIKGGTDIQEQPYMITKTNYY